MLTFDDLISLCYDLSFSQGFYGRLFEQLSQATDEQKQEITNAMEKANLKTTLDIILWIEQ